MNILPTDSHSRRVACATGVAGLIGVNMFIQVVIERVLYIAQALLRLQLINIR